MKRTNLVLRFNDGMVGSFANKEDLVEWFKKEGVSTLILTDDCDEDEGGGVSIEEGVDELIKNGGMGLSMVCWNEELVEMGDDYVDIGVYEIEVK
jgi:hypothetical protein